MFRGVCWRVWCAAKCHVLSCDVMRPLAPPVSASPLSPRVAHVSRPFPAWLSGSFAFRNRKGGPASRLSSTPILPRLPPCQIPGAARAQSLERLRAGSSMCASWVRRPPVSSRLPERPPPGPAIEPETHACGTPPQSVPYRERWYESLEHCSRASHAARASRRARSRCASRWSARPSSTASISASYARCLSTTMRARKRARKASFANRPWQ